MNYLSVENLTKSYTERILFENISFGIQKGQKVALVAKNGTGKSTLLKIITGTETPSSGKIAIRKDTKIGFLDQNPDFGTSKTVMQAVLNAETPLIQAVISYEKALLTLEGLEEALNQMDVLKAWDFDTKIKQILSKLNINDLDKEISTLSGGQKKRVALAKVLIEEPDFLILDEPTNHLDLDMIEWLENYLANAQTSLLMVTHDRYFLERVCNEIIELDNEKLYRYTGNYSYFLEKKAEREQIENAEVSKAKNLYTKELDWIRRQPRARGTKAKYRVEAFDAVKEKAHQDLRENKLEMDFKMNRLGGKILELEHLDKNFGPLKIMDDFSYTFKKGERIGIVGKNGVGKSTFLNILTEKEKADKGVISKGETVIYGYYTQDGIKLAEDKRVMDFIQEIAEVIEVGKGLQITPSQLLDQFLFDKDRKYAYISKLSGGEKRRLYLLTILLKNPNFLILDEPTNDLDIVTLQVLEDFLESFPGCLLIVSHDRYFMDKLADHLFIFEGDGKIKDYNGKYSDYRESIKTDDKKPKNIPVKIEKSESKAEDKKKLSFKEKQEYEELEKEIANLESQKSKLGNLMDANGLEHKELQKIADELTGIIALIDNKTNRWLELAEHI